MTRPPPRSPLFPYPPLSRSPAVLVPFRGSAIAEDALEAYVRWMAGQQIAGVAVWAPTGRGPHLSTDQRRPVLQTGRAAPPLSGIVAGTGGIQMARQAKSGGADALPA